MFQEAALFPWLTVAGNIAWPSSSGACRSGSAGPGRATCSTPSTSSGFGDKRPHELSGGMRQRVALARAFAQDADILLMDEPFGALDAMTRDLLHDELERLWADRDFTVVFVTHNVREAARLADRIVLLSSRPGRVVDEFDVDIPRPRRIDSPEVSRPRRRDHRPTPRGGAPPCHRLTDAPTRPSTELDRASSAGLDAARARRRRPAAELAAPRCGRATWPKLAAIAIALLIWQIVVWTRLEARVRPPPARDRSSRSSGTSSPTAPSGQAIRLTLQRAVHRLSPSPSVIGVVVGVGRRAEPHPALRPSAR